MEKAGKRISITIINSISFEGYHVVCHYPRHVCSRRLQRTSGGHFRLLKIDGFEETLNRTTKDFLRNGTPTCRTPEYDAISYCWGKVDLTAMISCNGVFLKVTPHLYDVLRHLHLYRPYPLRWLWVDGV
jgi:hypothetical protein